MIVDSSSLLLILESMVVDVQPTDGQTKDSLTRAVEYCTYSNAKVCTLSPVRIMRCRSDNHQPAGYEGVEYSIRSNVLRGRH